MEIKKVSVIGTGTMGAGIVQAFAQAGRQVMMKSRSEASNAKALAKISKSLSKLVEKGKMQQEEMDSILANIIPTTDYNAIADSDLIIEAAVEQMDLKVELFQMLDSICKPETIIATNTSSLSITGIAAALKRDTQVIGMHFFNPAPVMKLVEIIKGQKTSDEVYSAIHNLCVEIGKTPVAVNEAPGFVVMKSWMHASLAARIISSSVMYLSHIVRLSLMVPVKSEMLWFTVERLAAITSGGTFTEGHPSNLISPPHCL
jgi:3-hydroxybutyryl-CoA dehydrogenase